MDLIKHFSDPNRLKKKKQVLDMVKFLYRTPNPTRQGNLILSKEINE